MEHIAKIFFLSTTLAVCIGCRPSHPQPPQRQISDEPGYGGDGPVSVTVEDRHGAGTAPIAEGGGAATGKAWTVPGVGIELQPIPAGSFMMGSPASEKDRVYWDEVQHRVTISRPFWLGKYEVTQRQCESVMGQQPEPFHGSWQGCSGGAGELA